MAEDVLDVDGGDAVGHQVACVGVAERVRGGPDVKVSPFPVEGDNLLHAAHRERTVAAVTEERGRRRGGEAPRGVEGEEFVDTSLGGGVERYYAATRSFADGGGEVEESARLASGYDEVCDEARAFADAEPGVVEEEDKQVIPLAEGVSEIHGVENLPDFEFGQSEHFWKNLLGTSDLRLPPAYGRRVSRGTPTNALARQSLLGSLSLPAPKGPRMALPTWPLGMSVAPLGILLTPGGPHMPALGTNPKFPGGPQMEPTITNLG